MSALDSTQALECLNVSLRPDTFLKKLLLELNSTLQDVVGVEETAGFVSVVGQNIGGLINHEYKAALQLEKIPPEQIAEMLVDLKRRINGDFFIVEETPDKIILGNRQCPFGNDVIGRPAMCMMTSNVFGAIVADNIGYSKVELAETIADGAPGCRVVIYLRPTAESAASTGREYFKGFESA
jgi:predicted ArsR family transcriptional regulator